MISIILPFIVGNIFVTDVLNICESSYQNMNETDVVEITEQQYEKEKSKKKHYGRCIKRKFIGRIKQSRASMFLYAVDSTEQKVPANWHATDNNYHLIVIVGIGYIRKWRPFAYGI